MALRALSVQQFGAKSKNCCSLIKRLYATGGKDIQTSPVCIPVIKDTKATLASKEELLALEARKKARICVSEYENVGDCSGVPQEHIKTRRVRVYCPPKNAMQSGTNNINYWQIDFDTRERWENPLMGWTSTGDPMSNLQVEFATKDEAIEHCKKMGWKYYIQRPNTNNPKPRSYGTNFSWNKRTRVSTK